MEYGFRIHCQCGASCTIRIEMKPFGAIETKGVDGHFFPTAVGQLFMHAGWVERLGKDGIVWSCSVECSLKVP